MVMTAATLWAVNGTVSKVILTTGLSSLRLAQVRSTGAFLLIALALAALRPETLRLRRRELPYFILFGAGGLAAAGLLSLAGAAAYRIAVAVDAGSFAVCALLLALLAVAARAAGIRAFRAFVLEENAPMRERDLAGPRMRSSRLPTRPSAVPAWLRIARGSAS